MPKTHTSYRSRTDIRSNLRTIFVEGVAFSVMVGIGESYLPAFVLALGMGEVISGLIATVPLVAGGFLQLAAPFGVQLTGSHRRWSVLCAALQASSFVPLVVAAIAGRIPCLVLFLIAAVYWGAGMAIAPAWNVWVERLVPTSVRTRYFARRTSATNLGILAGLLGGGLILDHLRNDSRHVLGFALLFAVASLARFVSAALLQAQRQPALPPMPHRASEVIRLIRNLPRSSGGPLLVYMLVLTVTVTIASPFFTAYMIRQLGMSYSEYMVLIATALATKVVVLPLFGHLARRFGLIWLLRAAWAGVAVVPGLWLVSDSYAYLLGLQVVAGAAWGAHELVTFLLLFEMIGAKERGTLLTAYNLGFALASAGGSALGGLVFDALGGATTGYYVLFGLSSVTRAFCLVLLLRIPGIHVPALPIVFRSIAVRPSMGLVLRPILATLRPNRRRRRPLPPTH